MNDGVLPQSNVIEKCQTTVKLQADTRQFPSPYYNDYQL